MHDLPIFPNIEVALIHGVAISPNTSDGISGARFSTLVRKKHRGKYYLQRVIRNIDYPIPVDVMTIFRDQNIFLGDIYRVLMLGKVNPKMILLYYGRPRPAFELDPDQRPEEERLIYNP